MRIVRLECVSGVIVCCVAFGIVLSRLGSRAKAALDLLTVLEAAVMQLMDIAMWYVPSDFFYPIEPS